ncbi:MAG TPA: anti-sigma factor [Alphaproteobacteria bacterium]
MSRPPSEPDLHGYLDNALSPERRADVAAWLETHADDAARVGLWRAINAGMGELYGPVAEEPIPPQLRMLAAGPERRRLGGLPMAASILLALAVGATGGWVLRGLDRVAIQSIAPIASAAAALPHDAAVAYAVYAPEVRHPVEVGADEEAHLCQWLTRRLGTDVKAPKLDALGFKLIGGRLLPSDKGPAALLMYEDAAKRRLTLYQVRGTPQPGSTEFRFAEENGVNVFSWFEGNAGFALAGKLARDELLKAAKATYDGFKS